MSEAEVIRNEAAKRIGERARALRKRRGLTLRDVEAASRQRGCAVSYAVLCQLEAGQRKWSLEIASRLCVVYGCTTDDIFASDELLAARDAVRALRGVIEQSAPHKPNTVAAAG